VVLQTPVGLEPTHDQDVLRQAVRALCASFADTYWRTVDADRAYPDAFIAALTEAGYLAALIPEEYDGAGLGLADACIILEEVNRSAVTRRPAMRRCTSWARCCGTASDEQKRHFLPPIAPRRAAATSVRGHRTERGQ